MKNHILTIRGGRWFVNDKRSDDWSFEEAEFVNNFIGKVKGNPQILKNLEGNSCKSCKKRKSFFEWVCCVLKIKKG